MTQFYLLSVLANMIAGLTLPGDYLGEKLPFLSSFENLRANKAAHTVIAVAVGVVKLIVLSTGRNHSLSTLRGDGDHGLEDSMALI
jgi:hypothetical protein